MPNASELVFGSGLWPMVRRKAELGRYAALRCLSHEIRDDDRSLAVARRKRYGLRTHAHSSPTLSVALG
eukprot:425984-Prymnesium_polylepis.2